MKQPLQYVVRVAIPVVAVAMLVALLPAPGQVPGKLPVIDKNEQQPYTEKVKGDPKTEAKEMETKFDMVPIPGGVFMMGSPSTEPGRNADEGPQHPVKIRPFWMAKCEITWDEFEIYQKE
jgi:formylglycine-generating enzyme required for sulfatase activity